MRIIFMGTPEFAVPILEALNEKYEIALVISQPNREKKKNELIDTPVARCAKNLGLEIFQPEKISMGYEKLLNLNADVLVTAAYGQYVPTKILKIFKKTINVHGSLLPKYRGGAPIQRSIMNGDKETGITIIEMAKNLDAGVIYAKKACPIEDTDTSTDMFIKLSHIGRDLLMSVIEDIYNGTIKGTIQDETKVTYAYNLTKEEEIVSFNKSAYLVARQINGLANDPGATIIFNNLRIKVLKARVIENNDKVLPGTILSLKKDFIVKALDKAVSLEEILVPGKKILKAKDFLNGQKIFKELDVI